MLWRVPDEAFEMAVTELADCLGRVAAVASRRVDPDFARSDRRRLIYFRVAGWPLFWRIDVEVVCESVAGNDAYDRHNPDAHDDSEWSPYESALLNGVAALKAINRRNPLLANELLVRGATRAGVARPVETSRSGVATYADRIAEREPAVRRLADELIAACHGTP